MSREKAEMSAAQFWEQFDHEPDLPQTTPVIDYRTLELWQEQGNL